MDFGQLPPSTLFDASLASLARADLERLALAPSRGDAAPFSVGAVQWTVPAWKGTVYPPGTAGGGTLAAYADAWNSIELNSSFYASPPGARVAEWKSSTPADFSFHVKAHRSLTHDEAVWRDPAARRARIAAFASTWEALGGKWASSFLQLPPHFDAAKAPALFRALADWRARLPDHPLHVEFRHASWFERRRLRPEFADALRSFGIGTVALDTPARRDLSHASLTSSCWVVRFLGQSTEAFGAPHAVDESRIDAWAIWLGELSRRGLGNFAFFVHTPDHYWTPHLARRFRDGLRARIGERSRLPRVPAAVDAGTAGAARTRLPLNGWGGMRRAVLADADFPLPFGPVLAFQPRKMKRLSLSPSLPVAPLRPTEGGIFDTGDFFPRFARLLGELEADGEPVDSPAPTPPSEAGTVRALRRRAYSRDEIDSALDSEAMWRLAHHV